MAAPYRIQRFQKLATKGGEPATGDLAAQAPAPAENQNIQSYMERLIKLIPAEVIAIYLTGKGIAVSSTFLGYWSLICLLLIIIVRIWGTRDTSNPTKKIQWPAVVISAISFVIWVYAVDGYFLSSNFNFESKEKYIVSLVILVWTFIIPIFYKGDQ